jgi:hypothetical protein
MRWKITNHKHHITNNIQGSIFKAQTTPPGGVGGLGLVLWDLEVICDLCFGACDFPTGRLVM